MLLNVKTVKSIVTQVLILVILFKSSIAIGIGNTFCQVLFLVLAILVVFTSIVNMPGWCTPCTEISKGSNNVTTDFQRMLECELRPFCTR